MPGYFQRRHEEKVDVKVYEKGTVSTLLIPSDLVDKLSFVLEMGYNPKSERVFFDFRSGLKMLLNKYRGFLANGNLPFQQKPKLTFQDDGNCLQRFSFRPDDADWFELGVLAYGCGVSRCWLFTYLINLELSGIALLVSRSEFQVGVTTSTISRPRLIHQITGKRRYIHRIIHFRI
jgi:hypothetical protein